MYSLKQAEADWLEAVGSASPAERKSRALRSLPYFSYLYAQCAGKPFEPPPDVMRTVEFLISQKIVRSRDALLDIGAGGGSYSLAFARRCAEVAALDLSTAGLQLIRERAARSGLSNLSVIRSAWEEFEPGRQYDVVFSSMCPAICSTEELLKAERLAVRSVCILTVTPGSFDRCRMELMDHFGVRGRGGMVTEALHYFHVLYLMGRQPNIQCWTDRRTSYSGVGAMVDRYRRYFSAFGIDPAVSVPYMEQYFAGRARGGLVEDETVMNRALIYWDVPEK